MPKRWKPWWKKMEFILPIAGYSCLASGLHNHLKTLKPSVQGKVAVASLPVSGTRGRQKLSFYWRGFVSPVGVGRPHNHRAAYLQSHSNPSSAKGGGGGKWRGSTSGASGSHGTFVNLHSRTPYMGGRGGKKCFWAPIVAVSLFWELLHRLRFCYLRIISMPRK